MPETKKEACRDCRFWLPHEDKNKGWCRRNPPTLFPTLDVYFPTTHNEDWCGEFQRVEAPND